MSARAIGTGTVSFGLVSIPVKLFSATQASAGVSFNLLHKKCGSRLKQHYMCPAENEKVERDDMVKGYEFAKDRYVTFTAEELKQLEEKASQSIEIAEFLPQTRVDPIYFDKAYYLGPEKGGEKAYRLLGEAMKRSGRCALGRWAARGKQYLVLIRPMGDALVMQQLLYADEVRAVSEVPLVAADVKEPELKLALQLIDQIAGEEFRPGAYEDDVRKRILDAIQRKVDGQEVSTAPADTPQAQVIDLMEALKASLARRESEVPATTAARAAEPAADYPAQARERKPARKSPRVTSESRAKTAGK
jgi:DNA end-binding protein Ku